MSVIAPFVIAVASVALLAPVQFARAATAPDAMRIIARTPLPGDGGWDYLTFDAAGHRLFVTHGDQVQVVDVRNGKQTGVIKNLHGVHGVALAPALHRGFIGNGKSNSVTVFDLDSLKTLATIADTGKNPDAIVYDPSSRHVLTFDGHSKADHATVIDAKTDKVIASIALPGTPEFAVADGRGHVFVNIESTSQLAQIDTASNTVAKVWSLAPCSSPSGLAMDIAHRRLFSVCDNQVMAVSDADAGKVVSTVVIGKGPDAVVFDSRKAMVYSSNGDSGTVTAVHEDAPDRYTVTATIPTQRSARTMALDPGAQRLYLSAAAFAPGRTAQGWPRIKPSSFTLLTVGDKP